MVLMSRHGPPTVGKICVVTSFRGRDIGAAARQSGLWVTTGAGAAARNSARDQARMRTQPACCARSRAHDLVLRT